MRGKYQKVADGLYCEIWMSSDALKVYSSAPASDRARAERIMDTLCNEGPDNLTKKQFASEGRFMNGSGDGKKVAIFAIKSYQVRVYGGWVSGTSLRFSCPETAIKKQQKANQRQLKRVATKIGDIDGD